MSSWIPASESPVTLDLYGRRSIETRFVFYLSALVLIMMTFSALIVCQEHYRSLHGQALELARMAVDWLESGGDEGALFSRLSDQPISPRIVAILSRPSGPGRRQRYGQDISEFEIQRDSDEGGDAVPRNARGPSCWVFIQTRDKGEYTVLISNVPARRQIIALIVTFIWITALTLLLHYFLARVMARVVLRPFKDFLEGMRYTIEGRYGFKFDKVERDEVGQLKQTFNYMQNQLEEKVLVEEKLYTQERLATVGHLAAGLAHEIRNPLAAVSSLTQMIAGSSGETPEKTREYALVILKEVNRLDQVITQLLNISRPKPPSLESCRISSILQGSLALMGFQASTRGITLEFENCWTNEFELGLDPVRLEQVMINLLKNGLEATDSGGMIRVRLDYEVENARALISVEDNGPGVDPEIMDHLFDPYFTSKPMGTGIGLVVCARILAEHGGTISVDRERTLGARFTLTLPNLLPETMDATGQEGTT